MRRASGIVTNARPTSKNQTRALRSTGREPVAIELGDTAYALLAKRAERDILSLKIGYDFDSSANVTDLPIRTIRVCDVIRVLTSN